MASRLLLFAAGIALLAGCATGKRALEQGQYYEAVTQAISRLQQNPDSKNARATLKQGYPLAVDFYKEEIRRAEATGDPFRYERIMDHYRALNNMYDALRRCPSCLSLVNNPRSYDRAYEQVRQQAAQARYDAGLAQLDPNDKYRSREAYGHFDRAEQLLPGFLDARQQREIAYDYASLKVILDIATVPSPRYSLSSEYFAQDLFQATHSRNINPFVQFMSPQEVQDAGIEPDQVVYMQFEDFVVGETHTVREIESVSRDSVNTGTVVVDGEKVPVYSTVTAKVSRFRKTVVSRGVLRVEIFDGRTQRMLDTERLPGEFVWSTEWGVFQGDERALSQQDKALCRVDEAYPPGPQQMFREFTRPIYDQTLRYLRSYYANY